MNRYLRTVIAALVLLMLAAGAALGAPSQKGLDHMSPVAASHQPSPEPAPADEDEQEPEEQVEQGEGTDGDGTPSDKLLDRIVDNFADQGVETDADAVAELAADYGVGGAVRILAWADAAGVDPSEIADMFDSGKGWGLIARELNEADEELNLHPGVGSVMSGGHGKSGEHGNSANAPGHDK